MGKKSGNLITESEQIVMDNDWPNGRVAAIMPSIPPHLDTPALRDAYRKRLRANLEGICPECGATMTMPSRRQRRKAKALGQPAHATMEHESWCPVGDDAFRKIMSAGMN